MLRASFLLPRFRRHICSHSGSNARWPASRAARSFPTPRLAKGPIGPIVTAHPGLAGPARPNLLFGQVRVAWVHLGAGGEDRLAVAILAGEGLRSRSAGRYPRQICGCSRRIWSTAGRMNIGAGDGDMDWMLHNRTVMWQAAHEMLLGSPLFFQIIQLERESPLSIPGAESSR